MKRRVVSSADAILGEIADLLIEIRDRLPEKPVYQEFVTGPVQLQEVPRDATQPQVKRGPGRPRKTAEKKVS